MNSLLSAFFAVAVCAVAALAVVTSIGCDPAATRADTPAAALGTTRPVAVVELFTSEGCSSCPPADDAMADLARDARKDGTLIFPLSFHVDYWNNLGWKDRFSDATYSVRQKAYAKALGDSNIYTPEIVLNGRVGFVGSDRAKLNQEVATSLKTPSVSTVTLKVKADADGKTVTVDYRLTGAPAGAVFNLAAVERDLKTKVDAGENGGRTLKHSNVVRAFDSRTLDANNSAGTVTLKLPDDSVLKNVAVVGYVQEAKTMAVTGATATDVIAAR